MAEDNTEVKIVGQHLKSALASPEINHHHNRNYKTSDSVMNVTSFFSILKYVFTIRKELLFPFLALLYICIHTFYNCYSDFFFTGSEILQAFKSLITVSLGPESETTTKWGFEEEQ